MVDFENSASEVRNRINAMLSENGLTQNSVAAGAGGKYKTPQTITGAGNVTGKNATVIGQQTLNKLK